MHSDIIRKSFLSSHTGLNIEFLSKTTQIVCGNWRSQLNHFRTLPTNILHQLQWHLFNFNICAWSDGCSSVGKAGQLVIGRLLVQIPDPPGWPVPHVKLSLSKILNPKLLLRAPRGAGARRQLGLAPATMYVCMQCLCGCMYVEHNIETHN